jgi:hypothetical protein
MNSIAHESNIRALRSDVIMAVPTLPDVTRIVWPLQPTTTAPGTP